MSFRRLLSLRNFNFQSRLHESSHLLGGSKSCISTFDVNVPKISGRIIGPDIFKSQCAFHWRPGGTMLLPPEKVVSLNICLNGGRSMSTQAHVKPPPQARQMGSLKVAMLSPGIVYDPYVPREPISFLQRWFTRSGWRRTKEDIILEIKSAYTMHKLRKSGYRRDKFYVQAFDLYKEINILMAIGDKALLRKTVTEKMYSALKNEIKQRESIWSRVYLEIIEPAVLIRTLRARLIGVDPKDHSKVFVQLTLEFRTKQKFEAYNSKGEVVKGDKNKEVLVRDVWVFEKSLFHKGAYWRLCGRLSA